MSVEEPVPVDLQHDEDANRYVLRSSGETVGLIEYRPEGEVLNLLHTEVLPQGRGRGVGSVLVREVLDDIRAHDRRIIATCPFVKRFVEEHPGYVDLVAT